MKNMGAKASTGIEPSHTPHQRPWQLLWHLPWPLPALLAWGLAWALFIALQRSPAPTWLAPLAATAVGAALALWVGHWGHTRWRQLFVALGFPLSLLASGLGAALPAWAWLAPLALLLALYPVQAWRDAPLFPTPVGALGGLSAQAPLPEGSAVLDAGCGLGDGLRELRRAYPHAPLHGVEWSWPLRLLCALRCRLLGLSAQVRRGDIWREDWSAYGLVYLFQRPESMARAFDKATQELRPGAWLASLEFKVPGVAPSAVHHCADGRPVWFYRAPLQRPSGSHAERLHDTTLGKNDKSM
jgi:hypothetical protein